VIVILVAVKRRVFWMWRHRTKLLGGVGVAAGGLESSLQSHPDLHLPGRGVLLMVFGGAVIVVGAYNSLAQFFGWQDPQDPTP
jgi:hypothetical protein